MHTDDFYTDLERQLLGAAPRPRLLLRATPVVLTAAVLAAVTWSLATAGGDDERAVVVPPAATPACAAPAVAQPGQAPEALLSAFAGLREGRPTKPPEAFLRANRQAVEIWPDGIRLVGEFGRETYYLIPARVFARKDVEFVDDRCSTGIRAGAEPELGACLLSTHAGGAQRACETMANIRAGAILIDRGEQGVAGLALDGVTSMTYTHDTAIGYADVDLSLWRVPHPVDSVQPRE